MTQHLLLMMLAPPLVWLADPLLPLVRGLPRPIRHYWVRPLLQSRGLRRALARLSHPAAAWPIYVAVTWLWHLPSMFQLALRSGGWHWLEHASFFAAALLFWYPVVRPYPARPAWLTWWLVPYLILADVQNTVLSAIFAFADHPLYPHYADVPRLGGLSAIDDQRLAGVLMWVPGSVAFLLPLFFIGLRLLKGPAAALGPALPAARSTRPAGYVPLPIVERAASTRRAPQRMRFDLLRVRLVGRVLGWRPLRTILQCALAALAAVVIWDGLRGPQAAPLNLAGVLPWIHWRGFLIIGLLVAGNVFCFACPFTLPRALARRLLPPGRDWPRALRSKWLAVLLAALFFWAYESFALWDRPWWTAWIAIAYFVAAMVVDAVFRGAAFCKYVCPIGQFNFVQSLVSPLSVEVREPATCASCHTRECLAGGGGIPGCQLELLQPRKVGNMDCTFCLDCVHACPHDNVGLIAGLPGRDLWSDSARSGIGRFSRRPDLAALVLVLVFAALANAAGMVEPVVAWEDWLQAALGWESPLGVTSRTGRLDAVDCSAGGGGGLRCSEPPTVRSVEPWHANATRYAFALVPLGAAMWTAHYSFHLLTSYAAVLPAASRWASDLGFSPAATASWPAACCQPVGDWLPRLEILLLDVGLLLSLYTGYRLAQARDAPAGDRVPVLAPWALLMAWLFAAGVWIVLQPMQMRGTLPTTGTLQMADAESGL